MSRLVVVGDALLDRDVHGQVERICADAPVPVVDVVADRSRPGGAALAAALLAADGHSVVLVAGLADDGAGHEVRRLLHVAGVELVDVGLDGPTPEKVRVRSGGQSLLRLDRGGDGRPGRLGPSAEAAIADADGVLVADYGRGVAAADDVRRALQGVRARRPVVWDPHPKGPEPVPGVRLATPNLAEATGRTGRPAVERRDRVPAAVAAADELARRWGAGVAVTMGEQGAVLAGHGGPALVVSASAVEGDACGAGDRFAGAALAALAGGAVVSEAVEGAVAAASRFVAAGGASTWDLARIEARARPLAATAPHAGAVAAAARARGELVVATGGCFDLLHAGHVAMLAAARRLGGCLVVLLNSDASVRRLKGPGRPAQPEADRAAVLQALGVVDAVVVFDEDTPAEALGRLRPDLFVKGADYAAEQLPEADVVASWGGRAVVVPFLDGRSTTRLLEGGMRAHR